VPFVDWELQGAMKLAATAVDDLTDKPVVGAAIRVEAGYRDWSATSAEDGEFEIEGLPPGPVRVTVEADGYARQSWGVDLAGGQASVAASSQPSSRPAVGAVPGSRVVRLKPERIVHLVVVNEADTAIPGVSVECYDEGNKDYRHSVTNGEGRLTIRGLQSDAAGLAVRLSHEGYVSSVEFDRLLKETRTTVTRSPMERGD
jgi:hypothetical protein